ncbi:glycosyltransferase [Vibrio sp. Isolate30]|uniref:glycosyltransferase family 2 protein n=1 Tax=Vibrio sp. Isolate30 TaxID=2908536 RepID=UPI001EFDAFE5|nr:glycosyltransferase [Vibrio sp. Isolate30]MCG9632642.1 glycosyltransferase [Vibrio sp. Isolate30]
MSITIGIPFYNAESYLLEAIQSVLAQTFKDWELILIDDGSSDSSLEIARSIDDHRVRVFSDGENKKLAFRLNQIVDLAKFDLIARMDADDLMHPRRLEEQFALLSSNPNCDLVSSGVASIDAHSSIQGVRRAVNPPPINSERLLKNQHNIVHASILVRKEWMLRNRYDENIARAQDYELWVRAYSKSDLNVIFSPKIHYFYLEEENITRDKLVSAYKTGLLILDKYSDLFSFKLKEQAIFILKILLVYLLSLFGKLDYLLTRRNSGVLDVEDIYEVENAIKEIKSTVIPRKVIND